MSTSTTPATSATANVSGSQSSVAEQAPNSPETGAWRHLVLEIEVPDEEGRSQAIQQQLDQIAAQGWELVSLTSIVTHQPVPGGMEALGARDTLLAAFKRHDQV